MDRETRNTIEALKQDRYQTALTYGVLVGAGLVLAVITLAIVLSTLGQLY
jgi:hypothetical protein